jgi:MarR family 2-MHQ and catechol resistance regulon transcriptional repressor
MQVDNKSETKVKHDLKDRKVDLDQLIDRPKVQSWMSLFNTYRNVFSYLDIQLSKYDCSVAKFQILYNLYFKGSLTPVQLSKILRVSRANISGFIRRMSLDGLILASLENGSSKRPAYKLSRKGIRSFEEIYPVHIENIEEIFTSFSEEQIDLLSTISDKAINQKSIVEH